MKAKRILAIVLTFVMLMGTLLLTACNSTGDDPVKDTTTAQKPSDTTKPVGGGDEEKQPTREDAEPTSDKNYSGRTVNILTLTGSSLLQGQENDVQSISDMLATRTLYIEEKYDIEMMLTCVDGREDMSTLQASYLGGDQLYDMIAPHPTINLAPLMQSGMLQDLNDSAAFGGYIDLTKLWWNQSQVEAFNVNDRLFIGSPDFNLNKRGVSVLVMNKETWDNMYQDEDIYDVVFDGKWTLDKMIDVVNENYDETADEYGYVGSNGIGGFYTGVGGTLLVKGEDGGWVHKYDVDLCSTLAEKLYAMLIGPQALLEQYYYSGFPTSNVWKAFSEGRGLLQAMDIDYFGKLLATLDFQTAYVPYPKLNEQQEKYLGGGGTGFMGIPNDAKDLEFCGLIMENVNWHTYHYFRPIYFDSYLSVMVSKNENDYKVIEMAVNNGVFDFGNILDNSGLEPGTAAGMWTEVIVNNLSTDVASYIEEHEEANNEKFQAILDEIY